MKLKHNLTNSSWENPRQWILYKQYIAYKIKQKLKLQHHQIKNHNFQNPTKKKRKRLSQGLLHTNSKTQVTPFKNASHFHWNATHFYSNTHFLKHSQLSHTNKKNRLWAIIHVRLKVHTTNNINKKGRQLCRSKQNWPNTHGGYRESH